MPNVTFQPLCLQLHTLFFSFWFSCPVTETLHLLSFPHSSLGLRYYFSICFPYSDWIISMVHLQVHRCFSSVTHSDTELSSEVFISVPVLKFPFLFFFISSISLLGLTFPFVLRAYQIACWSCFEIPTTESQHLCHPGGIFFHSRGDFPGCLWDG